MIDISASDFNAFCQLLRDTQSLFDALIVFENKKLDIISANDVDALDQSMKEEQAYILKMKGLDLKREQWQEKFGFQDLPLKQMAERFNGAEKEMLLSLHNALSVKSEELKSIIAAAKKYIDLHVNGIGILLDQLENGESTYNQNGEKTVKIPPKRFTPTKV